ncbi:MAG: cytochrome b/b6 domain-containing protein [Planctomycetota bacterium]
MSDGDAGIYVRTVPERLWHVLHGVSVLGLIFSGAALGFPDVAPILGPDGASGLHSACAKLLLFDFILWLIYVLATRRIRFFLPRRRDLLDGIAAQGRHYLGGFLKKDQPPFPVSKKEKFNPLQKWAYLLVMGALVPLLIATGIALIGADQTGASGAGTAGFAVSAHRLLAAASLFFLLVHVALAFVARSARDSFRSLLTGYVRARGSAQGEAPSDS